MKCFGQKEGSHQCRVLKKAWIPDDCDGCRFAKPEREVTNGKRYPFNPERYVPKYPKEGEEDEHC